MESLTSCRFCLHIITDKDFKLIDDVAKYMLNSLSVKLNFKMPNHQIMCGGCSEKLFAAFQFKSTCLYTDSTIFPYVNNDETVKLDLREIYLKENGSEGFTDVSNDQKICALCLQLAKDRFTYICEVEEDLIEKFIPEMNFSIIESPIACEICLQSLTVHTAFINKCVEYKKKNCEDLAKVETVDIKIKTEIFKAEEDYEVAFEEIWSKPVKSEFSDIKLEENQIWDTSLQCQTDSTHTERNKGLYELDYRKQTSAQSTFANNQSEECSFKSTSESPSADHERQHKRASEAQVNNSDPTSKIQCSITGLKVREYQCDKCTYNTKRKDYFMQHKLIHKDASEVQMYECDKCLYRSIHEVNLRRHQSKHKYPSEVKMFKYDKCTYEAKLKNNLVTHCLKHKDPSEVRMFKCDGCDYKSIRKGDIRKHQSTHKDPSELKMYKCQKCKFITKHKWSLIQHSLSHKDPTEVQVVQCDECDYKTNRKDHLKKHQLRHKDASEVREFQCDECDYKSKQKGHLKRHQLTHKDPSELKMYKCEKCKFITKRKCSLIKHCLSHRDPTEVRVFQCDECDYKSIQKEHLKSHQLRHKDPSEVRVFKCDECDYKSIHKGILNRHQLIHKDPSEVPVFQCDECDYKSKQKAHLKRHQLRRHKDPAEVQMENGY